ncbi:3-phosphoshikimate 1-carboxyvinyltransferase [bacterium]|nr:3-phosphoshikimate 1-carboxyvinyltransferase [bacterium]
MPAKTFQLIRPTRHLQGSLDMPGDKSISHRALMLGAAARGTTIIANPGPGQDVQSTQQCLKDLGINVESIDNRLHIHGQSLDAWKKPETPLQAGNSGTTFRLLCGLLAGRNFSTTITGDESLKKRPMKRIIDPLKAMGISAFAQSGRAPLTLEAGSVKAIDYSSPVASGQIKSCILFAGLSAKGKTSVTEPALSRDHTERMLPAFGIPVYRDGLTVSICGSTKLTATEVHVPGDPSSAAFFAAAAALIPGSRICLQNIGCNPTRTGFFKILQSMGGNLSWGPVTKQCGEPRANLTIEYSQLKSICINASDIPSCIDELPLLAILATQAHGRSEIRHAAELRVKECDRITMTTRNLKAMGAKVHEHEDGWTIDGPTVLEGTAIETAGDHRMAMAFAIAGLKANNVTLIRNADCVAVSYPQFFTDIRSIAHE